MTVLRAVCSADVTADAPTDLKEKADHHRQGCAQKPRSRSSLWADHMRRCNSHGVRFLNCPLGWLGALAKNAGTSPQCTTQTVKMIKRLRSSGVRATKLRLNEYPTKRSGFAASTLRARFFGATVSVKPALWRKLQIASQSVAVRPSSFRRGKLIGNKGVLRRASLLPRSSLLATVNSCWIRASD